MDYYPQIAGRFQDTIELIAMSVDSLAQPIEHGSEIITTALLEERKVITCGNGTDAALAQIFASNLMNRFEHDRPALPALALGPDSTSLTAIASSTELDQMYARQVSALGRSGDILLCISSGQSHQSLHLAIEQAHSGGLQVLALCNGDDGALARTLGASDIALAVTATRQPRVLELQLMVIQNLCEMIDQRLFGVYDQE